MKSKKTSYMITFYCMTTAIVLTFVLAILNLINE